ncbi:MAG: XRE family transcriptional regulator [Agitococcus sp.]|jgi:Zn-dependent peptidase ImmA (M78 family)/transcriptional regulator with XRE-family HTH domain|nr:XRE family transcriptional regulator [Agitococcus sp.]
MSIDQIELGRRIRLAREGNGMTQEELGQQIELSRVAVTQIEQGKRGVSGLELGRIAYLLGRDIREFFNAEFREHDVMAALFRAQPDVLEQEDVLIALRSSMALGREMTNLEHILGIDRVEMLTATYELPLPKRRIDAIRQGERVAREERHRLGLGIVPVGDITDLLEAQGVRTAIVVLPKNISGLALFEPSVGLLVVVNREHIEERCRFSTAHEYAHVLMDRSRLGAVSREEDKADLIEVRANAFAAEFLMPTEGVNQFMAALGKGQSSRSIMSVYNGLSEVEVESRTAPGTQDVQLYDVALLANHFGVSRIFALYRLRNIGLLTEAELDKLKASESRSGKAISELLKVKKRADDGRDEFMRRFLGLALEAFRRDEISHGKLLELGQMVSIEPEIMEALLDSLALELSEDD